MALIILLFKKQAREVYNKYMEPLHNTRECLKAKILDFLNNVAKGSISGVNLLAKLLLFRILNQEILITFNLRKLKLFHRKLWLSLALSPMILIN